MTAFGPIVISPSNSLAHLWSGLRWGLCIVAIGILFFAEMPFWMKVAAMLLVVGLTLREQRIAKKPATYRLLFDGEYWYQNQTDLLGKMTAARVWDAVVIMTFYQGGVRRYLVVPRDALPLQEYAALRSWIFTQLQSEG